MWRRAKESVKGNGREEVTAWLIAVTGRPRKDGARYEPTITAQAPFDSRALASPEKVKLFPGFPRSSFDMNAHFPSFTRISLLALALILGSGRLAALETTTNQVFQVTPGGQLLMEVDRGSIELATANDHTVSVTVVREVKRANEAQAREILAAHQLAFEQQGNTVIVRAKSPKDRPWKWRQPQLSIRYQVTLPRQFNLDLSTAGGSIKVPDLIGKVDVETAGGSISIGEVDGVVQADTAGGSISVAAATGAIKVETAGGSIRLGTMGAAVKAETAGGSIRIQSAAGPVQAETSGGSIELGEMRGPVQADTSGGSISARFPRSPQGDVSLATSGGSISVYLAEDAQCQLDAKSSGGRVSSDLTVTTAGKPAKSELRGTIGTGGPKVVLRTSGGGIHVKKLAAVR